MSLQLRQNVNMRLEQKLKLTPQMIQSIEILLLPQLALEERIMTEVESNPTLELLDAEPDALTPPTLSASEGDNNKDQFSSEDLDWMLRRKQRSNDEDGPDKMEAL